MIMITRRQILIVAMGCLMGLPIGIQAGQMSSSCLEEKRYIRRGKENWRWFDQLGIKRPEWSISLLKTNYFLGEPIIARVLVKNTNTDFILELSPPDNGGMVLSIISVSSTRLSDGNLAEPVEVIKSPVDIDERGMSLSRAACGGKPVILKPGETAQFNIWLNANYFDKTMSSADRTDCGWHTGIGCYQPGKYRITVKYMNIEGLSHFGDRYIPADKRFLAEGKRLDKSKPVLIPPEPVGLGSVEVEITSLGKDSLIVPLLKTWDGLARQKESDVFCIDQPERLRTILDDPIFKDRKLAYLKASLELSMIACQVDMGELEKMQTALEKGRLALKPDPLAEVYGLVECRVLKAMGKTGEALKLAEEINSPDTVVLVEDLKHALKEAEEKKQNPQPGK